MGQTFLDKKVVIVADYRERNVINYLEYYDCKVKEMNLTVGDFIISERIGVERKTFQDFVNSVFDGRLFKQAAKLKETFSAPIIIIEGRRYFGKVNKNSLRGAMASLVVDFGIPIIQTDNEEDTAGLLFSMARREQEDLKKNISIRGKKKKKDIPELQKYLISGLPFVNSKMSKTLLEKFGTPERVFTASESELKKIRGIGEKKAKLIKKILQTKYRGEKDE